MWMINELNDYDYYILILILRDIEMLLLMLMRMLREMSYYDRDGHGQHMDTRFLSRSCATLG